MCSSPQRSAQCVAPPRPALSATATTAPEHSLPTVTPSAQTYSPNRLGVVPASAARARLSRHGMRYVGSFMWPRTPYAGFHPHGGQASCDASCYRMFTCVCRHRSCKFLYLLLLQ